MVVYSQLRNQLFHIYLQFWLKSAAANFDTGKIRFDIGKEAYVITYIDADGAQHTLSRGLITCASSRCWRQSVQFGGSQQNQGTCPEEGPHNVEHT